MGLLPLDEVRRRLRAVGQSDGGVQSIPIDRIVGSVDRSGDFDRSFGARRSLSRRRLKSLREAFAEREPPAIDVYELGGLYFVADGHHRIALARERDAHFIDAEVTVLHTDYELPPDVDIARLVHTEQRRAMMEESGLAAAKPEVEIEFARPRGYPELLETIKAHGYDLAVQRGGELPAREEIAADWHERVFEPGVAAVRDAGLPDLYPFKTEADLFLWIYERRRDLRVLDPEADFADAAAFAAAEGVSRRDRKVIEGEKAKPLRPGGP